MKDALAEQPRVRELWFAFQAVHLCEAVRDWLADNGIEPTMADAAEAGGNRTAGRR